MQRYHFWANIYSLPSMPTHLAFPSDSFSGLSRFHISAFTPAMTAVLPMVSFSFICINPCTDQFYFQSNLHLPSLLYLQKTQTGGQSNFEVYVHCYKHVQYPESYWTQTNCLRNQNLLKAPVSLCLGKWKLVWNKFVFKFTNLDNISWLLSHSLFRIVFSSYSTWWQTSFDVCIQLFFPAC